MGQIYFPKKIFVFFSRKKILVFFPGKKFLFFFQEKFSCFFSKKFLFFCSKILFFFQKKFFCFFKKNSFVFSKKILLFFQKKFFCFFKKNSFVFCLFLIWIKERNFVKTWNPGEGFNNLIEPYRPYRFCWSKWEKNVVGRLNVNVIHFDWAVFLLFFLKRENWKNNELRQIYVNGWSITRTLTTTPFTFL